MELLVFILMTCLTTVALSKKTLSQEGEEEKTSGEFENALKSKGFADKTKFIKEFYLQHKAVYITAPPGFGKSTNLDMMKTFFEPVVLNNGTRLAPNTTLNYELFSKPPLHRWKKLEIFKDKEFVDAHFGRQPVLHISFKDIEVSNSASFTDSLETIVRKAFIKHEYLIHSEEIDKIHKKEFAEFIDENLSKIFFPIYSHHGKGDNWINAQIRTKAQLLAFMLKTRFNKPCILLIDDYDAHVMKIINHGKIPEARVKQIVTRIKVFVSALAKGNANVDKVLATGCLRLTNTLPSHANNIKHRAVFEAPWLSPYYGFNEEDIANIYSFYSPTFTLNDLKNWYKGYRNLRTKGIIYNPVSVLQALQNNELNRYWSKPTPVSKFSNLFSYTNLKAEIAAAVEGDTIKFSLIQSFEPNKILYLQILMRNAASSTEGYTLAGNDRNFIRQYLLDCGYLTYVSANFSSYSSVETAIPNKEIKEALKDVLKTVNNASLQPFTEAICGLNKTQESSVDLKSIT